MKIVSSFKNNLNLEKAAVPAMHLLTLLVVLTILSQNKFTVGVFVDLSKVFLLNVVCMT